MICPSSSAPLTEEERTVIRDTLGLLAEVPWGDLNVSDLMNRLNLTRETFPETLKSKEALLSGFVRFIDEETSNLLGPDPQEVPPNDRLFDFIMCRFDVMAPYKEGLQTIWQDLPSHPLSFAPAFVQGFLSLNHFLEKTGFHRHPLCDKLYLGAFGAFYLSAVKVWHEDDSPDQSKTMAYVDQGLKKLNILLTFAL